MGCRRKNTLCLSLDFGANDGTLLPRLTRLETSPSPQKRLVLKFPNINTRAAPCFCEEWKLFTRVGWLFQYPLGSDLKGIRVNRSDSLLCILLLIALYACILLTISLT